MSVEYKIYLDNIDISSQVSSDVKVTVSESNIHNSISFKSLSKELYNKANPHIMEGEVRIRLEIGLRIMYFLLEERSGDYTGTVEYWGRDATVRDAAPWAIDKVIEESVVMRSAKELCEDIMDFCSINWEIVDWLLPTTFNSKGTPIEIVSKIVEETGAILRAQDDGSITVKYQYKVRPYELKDYIGSRIEYAPNIIVGLKYDTTVGQHYNIVTVSCDVADKDAPILELVEDEINASEIPIGTTVYVKVYWFEEFPEITGNSVISNYITDGIITMDSTGTTTHTEYLTFSDGVASTKYPISTIGSIEWIGKPDTITSLDKYSRELFILNETDYKIAKITYTSEYYLYSLSKHDVEMLVAAWTINNSFSEALKIITPPISKDSTGNIVDKEGTDISINNVTDSNLLIKKGENWIDNNKYNYTTLNFESPYNDLCIDGIVAWIDPEIMIIGNYHISQSDIEIKGAKVINTIQAIRWEN